jgi:hypothetical protein
MSPPAADTPSTDRFVAARIIDPLGVRFLAER